MNTASPETVRAPDDDPWADWLLHERSAGDPVYEMRIQARVAGYIDHALQRLPQTTPTSLLDFGCGDGALGLRALQRWPSLRVVFADPSLELLRRASARAEAAGVHAHSSFVQLGPRGLEELPDASFDAVVTRSALAYVSDKPRLLAQWHRLLRAGGAISLAEPIFRDEAVAACAQRAALEHAADDDASRLLRLLHRWRAHQFPDTEQALAESCHCNFSERDLFAWAAQAGFGDLRLELHIESGPSLAPDWDRFTRHTPHPYAKSLRDVLDWECGAEERTLLEGLLRHSWEQGRIVSVERMAYLSARRP